VKKRGHHRREGKVIAAPPTKRNKVKNNKQIRTWEARGKEESSKLMNRWGGVIAVGEEKGAESVEGEANYLYEWRTRADLDNTDSRREGEKIRVRTRETK